MHDLLRNAAAKDLQYYARRCKSFYAKGLDKIKKEKKGYDWKSKFRLLAGPFFQLEILRLNPHEAGDPKKSKKNYQMLVKRLMKAGTNDLGRMKFVLSNSNPSCCDMFSQRILYTYHNF